MAGYWIGLEVAEADRIAFGKMVDKYLNGDEWDELATVQGYVRVIRYEADHSLKYGLHQMSEDTDCPPFAYQCDTDDEDCDIMGLFFEGQHLVIETNTNRDLIFTEQKERFREYVSASRLAKLN